MLPRHRTCLHTCSWYSVNVLLIKQPALSLRCDGSPLCAYSRPVLTAAHRSLHPQGHPPTSLEPFFQLCHSMVLLLALMILLPPKNLLRRLYPCHFVFTSSIPSYPLKPSSKVPSSGSFHHIPNQARPSLMGSLEPILLHSLSHN